MVGAALVEAEYISMPNLKLLYVRTRKRKEKKKNVSEGSVKFSQINLLYFTYETGSIFNSPSNKGGKYK